MRCEPRFLAKDEVFVFLFETVECRCFQRRKVEIFAGGRVKTPLMVSELAALVIKLVVRETKS